MTQRPTFCTSPSQWKSCWWILTRTGLGLKHSQFLASDFFFWWFYNWYRLPTTLQIQHCKDFPQGDVFAFSWLPCDTPKEIKEFSDKEFSICKAVCLFSFSNRYLYFIISGDNLLFGARMKTTLLKEFCSLMISALKYYIVHLCCMQAWVGGWNWSQSQSSTTLCPLPNWPSQSPLHKVMVIPCRAVMIISLYE